MAPWCEMPPEGMGIHTIALFTFKYISIHQHIHRNHRGSNLLTTIQIYLLQNTNVLFFTPEPSLQLLKRMFFMVFVFTPPHVPRCKYHSGYPPIFNLHTCCRKTFLYFLYSWQPHWYIQRYFKWDTHTGSQ